MEKCGLWVSQTGFKFSLPFTSLRTVDGLLGCSVAQFPLLKYRHNNNLAYTSQHCYTDYANRYMASLSNLFIRWIGRHPINPLCALLGVEISPYWNTSHLWAGGCVSKGYPEDPKDSLSCLIRGHRIWMLVALFFLCYTPFFLFGFFLLLLVVLAPTSSSSPLLGLHTKPQPLSVPGPEASPPGLGLWKQACHWPLSASHDAPLPI